LQDHDRALILGRRSFGKALMQTVFFLPHGDNVWLTVGRVLTPNGRFIQRRYRGLGYEQYLSFAGRSGAEDDTTEILRTDNGRPVRGGGGIAPDVSLPGAARLPVWWSAAADSGLDDAVADSVAFTLGAAPADRAAWLTAPDEWRRRLVPPFLARVRARFGVAAQPDSSVERRLARIMAARASEVRWGPDAREEFVLRNDPDVQAALAHFPRLPQLLAPPQR
jgi:carboxyl-terminal processing protease